MREEHLRYVLEIHRTGSINKAAENLYLSHQSLNRSLKTFENELGAAIFRRTQKGVELTAIGEQVIEKIDVLVAQYDALREAVDQHQALEERSARAFTINCSSYLRYPFVSQVTQKMLACFPQVKLITKMCPIDLDDLQDAFHVILTWDAHLKERLDGEQTMFWNVAVTKMYLIVSREHKLAKYKEISLDKALHYPFVSLQLGAGLMNPLLEWAQSKNLKVDIALETDHTPSYIKAIESGKYIGIWLGSALEMEELQHNDKLKALRIYDLPPLYIDGVMTRQSYVGCEDIVQELLKEMRC